jgi:casein kinase II subunit alpha
VRVPWTAFITERNKHMCSNEALDLLNKMLVYDKNLRINCVDAMKHTYFDPVREFVQE